MLCFLNKLIIITACFFVFVYNVQAQGEEKTTTTTTTSQNGTVVKREVVTVAPAPKEIIAPPPGYVTCSMVKGTWSQGIWIAEHKVCTYSSSPNGGVWVEGYWLCNNYDEAQALCLGWDWQPAHWQKTYTVY